jgi:hypothetical protein
MGLHIMSKIRKITRLVTEDIVGVTQDGTEIMGACDFAVMAVLENNRCNQAVVFEEELIKYFPADRSNWKDLEYYALIDMATLTVRSATQEEIASEDRKAFKYSDTDGYFVTCEPYSREVVVKAYPTLTELAQSISVPEDIDALRLYVKLQKEIARIVAEMK